MAVVWVTLGLRRCDTVWLVRRQGSGETCCLHLQCKNCSLLKWRKQALPKLSPLWEGQTSECVIVKLSPLWEGQTSECVIVKLSPLWEGQTSECVIVKLRMFWFALAVLQGLMLLSLQEICRRFRRTFHHKFCFNVGALLPHCTASNPRRERWRLMLSFLNYCAFHSFTDRPIWTTLTRLNRTEMFRVYKSVHHHIFKQINQPDASISQIYCSSFKYI